MRGMLAAIMGNEHDTRKATNIAILTGIASRKIFSDGGTVLDYRKMVHISAYGKATDDNGNEVKGNAVATFTFTIDEWENGAKEKLYAAMKRTAHLTFPELGILDSRPNRDITKAQRLMIAYMIDLAPENRSVDDKILAKAAGTNAGVIRKCRENLWLTADNVVTPEGYSARLREFA